MLPMYTMASFIVIASALCIAGCIATNWIAKRWGIDLEEDGVDFGEE